MAGAASQCVLFLTDSAAPRIVSHFGRLASESPFQTFLCLGGHVQSDVECIRIDYQSAGTRFRFRRPVRPLHRPRPFMPGTVDLLWLEAISCVSQKHSFDFYWLMEYDVDFTGHWSRFFADFEEDRSDLIASRICHRRDSERWRWWRNFDPPPEVTAEHHMMALFPLARLSSRLAAKVSEFYDRSPLGGHYEALLPTLCSYFAMEIEDISGKPDFGRGREWSASKSTFKVGCDGMPNRYYHEDPAAFDCLDTLWHPVKIAGSPNFRRKVLRRRTTRA